MIVTVFLLGATGYLGGAILADLVKHHKELRKEIKFTVLVRRADHIEAIRKLPVDIDIVEGTFDDTKLIAKHARTADITINAAGSDNIDLTNAILEGQKARVVEDKKDRAALLHTSGVAVFAGEERDGMHHPGYIWNDSKEEDIRAINNKMLHGPVDELILRTSEQDGYTESYIVCPGAIVGPSSGPVPTASLFFRFITQLALGHNKAVYIGEGSNVFYAVRLDDLIDLYRLVFERILSQEFAKESPYTRYYIGTSTPLAWKEIATSFGKTLKEMGKIETAKPSSITVDSLTDPSNELLVYTSASQNVQAERAKALGWKPRPVVLDDWVKVEYVEAAVGSVQPKK